MMAKSKNGVKSPAKLAKILAKNAPDASTAQKILAEAASAVTTEELAKHCKMIRWPRSLLWEVRYSLTQTSKESSV